MGLSLRQTIHLHWLLRLTMHPRWSLSKHAPLFISKTMYAPLFPSEENRQPCTITYLGLKYITYSHREIDPLLYERVLPAHWWSIKYKNVACSFRMFERPCLKDCILLDCMDKSLSRLGLKEMFGKEFSFSPDEHLYVNPICTSQRRDLLPPWE